MTLTLEQIKAIIPQRDPILLVDEVSELMHFPENPILPGVYSIEALAQTADILLLSMEQYTGKTPLFVGIDQAKFKRKVLPGMSLRMTATIQKENREKGIVSCEAVACDAQTGEVHTTAVVTLAMR